jgi:hypothetical protein
VFVSDPAGDILIDFEDGAFGGFVDDVGNAPDTVKNVLGALDDTGSKVFSLIEDSTGGQWTTIVCRSFTPSVPSILQFHYETFGFESGSFGDDQFTVWLRDASWNALLDPGVIDSGDSVVLEVTPTYGIQTNPYTTTSVIPEPATICLFAASLLGLFGLGTGELKGKRFLTFLKQNRLS